MTVSPEHQLIRKLSLAAAAAVGTGADEALELLGPPPGDPAGFAALDKGQRTAARALIKAIEQQQDIISRLYRTFLIAEAQDVSEMTARDIANRMEKLGGLEHAVAWSAVVKLRNRLAHEYPVSVTAQLERVREAAAAVPVVRGVLERLTWFLSHRGYLP